MSKSPLVRPPPGATPVPRYLPTYLQRAENRDAQNLSTTDPDTQFILLKIADMLSAVVVSVLESQPVSISKFAKQKP